MLINTEITQEENTQNNTEINTEVEQIETQTETTEKQPENTDYLSKYKERLGEEWNEKYENIIKKFSKDGELDTIEILKAHRNLEKAFSEKRQAPEKYEITYQEELQDYKIDENDELYTDFLSKAKEMNFTNEQVNGIVNLLSNHMKKNTDLLAQEEELSKQELQKRTEEIKKSIPNFEKRSTDIKNFLLSKLDKEEFSAFASSITTEAHMKAVEKLMKMNRDPVIPTPNNTTYTPKESVEDQIETLRNEMRKHSGDKEKLKQLDAQIYELYKKLHN